MHYLVGIFYLEGACNVQLILILAPLLFKVQANMMHLHLQVKDMFILSIQRCPLMVPPSVKQKSV